MFCSIACLKRDNTEVHGDNCGSRIITYESEQRAFMHRMLHRAVNVFETPKSRMKELTEATEDTAPFHSIFDFNFNEYCREPLLNDKIMLAAFGGKSGTDLNEMYDVSSIDHLLVKNLSSRLSSMLYFIAPFHFLTSKKINESETKLEFCHGKFVSCIGWTAHPLWLMFNTSCYPNAHLMVFGEQGVTALIIERPVKAGEQLFLATQRNYQWNMRDKSVRQAFWVKQYGFKCECEACTNDWKAEDYVEENASGSNRLILPQNLADAIEMFKQNNEYINKYHNEKYPTGEFKNSKKSFTNSKVKHFS